MAPLARRPPTSRPTPAAAPLRPWPAPKGQPTARRAASEPRASGWMRSVCALARTGSTGSGFTGADSALTGVVRITLAQAGCAPGAIAHHLLARCREGTDELPATALPRRAGARQWGRR